MRDARRRRPPLSLAMSSLLIAGFMMLALPGAPARAASSVLVDFGPESALAEVGKSVTRVVVVQDELGAPLPDQSVRIYFVSGPNDPGGTGSSPDATCTTDVTGSCVFTYTPSATGTDVLCAMVSGSPHVCNEPAADPELDDYMDVIDVVVVDGPLPTAEPTPTPDPTPTPSPDPTPTPSPDPTPTPSPDPTPSPTPTPTPTPD
ncbi:MAG: hypothetical protein FIA92_07790, partial [Chloroflexi bacterium]|nr:hypothetical protein [Chloroflexota bacterium]